MMCDRGNARTVMMVGDGRCFVVGILDLFSLFSWMTHSLGALKCTTRHVSVIAPMT